MDNYKGGVVYVNIPSLAAQYIACKAAYKKRIIAAADAAKDGHPDIYFLYKKVGSSHLHRCNEIISVMRYAGKLKEFWVTVRFLEDAKRAGLSINVLLNSVYGKFPKDNRR